MIPRCYVPRDRRAVAMHTAVPRDPHSMRELDGEAHIWEQEVPHQRCLPTGRQLRMGTGPHSPAPLSVPAIEMRLVVEVDGRRPRLVSPNIGRGSEILEAAPQT